MLANSLDNGWIPQEQPYLGMLAGPGAELPTLASVQAANKKRLQLVRRYRPENFDAHVPGLPPGLRKSVTPRPRNVEDDGKEGKAPRLVADRRPGREDVPLKKRVRVDVEQEEGSCILGGCERQRGHGVASRAVAITGQVSGMARNASRSIESVPTVPSIAEVSCLLGEKISRCSLRAAGPWHGTTPLAYLAELSTCSVHAPAPPPPLPPLSLCVVRSFVLAVGSGSFRRVTVCKEYVWMSEIVISSPCPLVMGMLRVLRRSQ